MPLPRPNLKQFDVMGTHLTLDEQSFQSLLSAAYTIQEHNDQVRKARLAPPTPPPRKPPAGFACPQCGALKATAESPCQNCNHLRPGERLQRNWASMWLMSQERDLWPERAVTESKAAPEPAANQRETPSPLDGEDRPHPQLTHDSASNALLAWPGVKEIAAETTPPPAVETTAEVEKGTSKKTRAIPDRELEKSNLPATHLNLAHPELDQPALEEEETEREGDRAATAELSQESSSLDAADAADQTFEATPFAEDDEFYRTEVENGETTGLRQFFADLRVKLRFRRADIYLGAAIIVAAAALLWPTVSAPRRGTLGPMDRALIAMGLAEAPAPVIHLKGDPGINVWVDPHTALYYCPGEDQYGKTADGRFTTQHDAQLDRFEPAGRSVCE